jgi:hypothetical protein
MITTAHFKQCCEDYLKNLRVIKEYHDKRGQGQATPDLSYRTDLHILLRHAQSAIQSQAFIMLESKKTVLNQTNSATGNAELKEVGRPDFTVLNEESLPIGYIEVEAIHTDLENLIGDAKQQNDGFCNNLDNFLLTNHLDFHLYVNGLLKSHFKFSLDRDEMTETDVNALLQLFKDFFDTTFHAKLGEQITSSEKLALMLARRTRQMRNQLLNSFLWDSKEVKELYDSFKTALLPALTQEEFADIYAQTITYGLFAARCRYKSNEQFTRHAITSLISESNPFLHQLFARIAKKDLDDSIAWIVDEIVLLLSGDYMSGVLATFENHKGQKDVVLEFYETFLTAYNTEKRNKMCGLSYTPEPVILYIVRSIDFLLKNFLKRPKGLADEQTYILDPAAGTGGFLFWVIHEIRKLVSFNSDTKDFENNRWSFYIENSQLLSRLFGFEFIVAPYVIAHFKMHLLLEQTGYLSESLKEQDRIGVYLTNTLLSLLDQTPFPNNEFLANELNQTLKIKHKYPILVVLGNPPLKNESNNPSRDNMGQLTDIGTLIEDYKKVKVEDYPVLTDEDKNLTIKDNYYILDEKNTKWLQNDYVKFIRFAQWRIDNTGEGIIAYVVSHDFLDNPTFRFMRYQLMLSFNRIYVYDLHGNYDKEKETFAKLRQNEEEKDENVFDNIAEGITILLCVKEKDNALKASIFHAEEWGKRSIKYEILANSDAGKTSWQELKPLSPFFLFIPHDITHSSEYQQGHKITDIFTRNSVGIITARDKLTIKTSKEAVFETVNDFAFLPPDEAREKYQLGKDTRDWRIEHAQRDLKRSGLIKDHFVPLSKVCPIHYRPYDIRYTYYTGRSKGFHCMPRKEVMRNLLPGYNNLALITSRLTKGEAFRHVQVAQHIVDIICTSSKTSNNGFVFPLYLYLEPSETEKIPFKKELNISAQFLKMLANRLELPEEEPYGLPIGVTAEDIFYYIYAILHSPTYRKRYAEFLKIDFPRVPFTSDMALFRDLGHLGQQLTVVHLLDTKAIPAFNTPKNPLLGSADSFSNNVIERIRYDNTQQRIYINQSQYFDKVTSEIWEYYLGGYQVCHKWLKDRSKRELTKEDILHYQRILISISETLRLMQAIDERIPEFPLE